MRRVRLALVAGLLLLLGGCAGGLLDPASVPPPAPPATTAAAVAPAQPSVSAKMVCEPEAQDDITEALGIAAQRVETPTWKDHLYSCRYDYAGGSFLMSVKELADDLTTTDYYEALGKQLGNTQSIDGLGQGAFITPNGSVVVRKDFKVLLVDDSTLPPKLASPPLTPSNVAMLVAKTIMGCWSGT
ncbi:MAG: hypothetical protein QOF00_4105 [Pseudonocardiales bacterium]|jgi:hypothetical protein|nr:hypothetical protein [Pseudonocardiales bacterium]